MKRTIFRDRETGRFASHATWNRSKAHGGTRYVRQRIAVKPKPKAPPKPRPPRPPRRTEEEEARIARQRAVEEEEAFQPYDLEVSADYEEPE